MHHLLPVRANRYGGQYSAAGQHASCPERYIGKAYVNSQEWDISGMAQCEQGVGCPVSETYTDAQFMVPMGCDQITMDAQKTGGRGIVNSFAPTRASGYRGELEISDDGFGGADVFDITVTLTCGNRGPTEGVTAGSTGVHNVRLSCVHQSQMQNAQHCQSTENGQCSGQSHYNAGEACRMGRVEVYNPSAHHANGAGTGTWGTVCGTSAHVSLCCWLPPLTCLGTWFAGHYFWDNTEMANVVCRQLGFQNGFIYTFGRTHLLPTLPIVAGFRTCQGMESNIFQCAEGGNPLDRDCWIGCRGADGQSGTADDTLDPTCTHAIDQGVICQVADSPQARNQANTDPCHHNTAGRGALYQADHQQPIIFACVEFYSTQCVYDVTNEELRNGMGSYMRAMRAFGECAEVIPE